MTLSTGSSLFRRKSCRSGIVELTRFPQIASTQPMSAPKRVTVSLSAQSSGMQKDEPAALPAYRQGNGFSLDSSEFCSWSADILRAWRSTQTPRNPGYRQLFFKWLAQAFGGRLTASRTDSVLDLATAFLTRGASAYLTHSTLLCSWRCEVCPVTGPPARLLFSLRFIIIHSIR